MRILFIGDVIGRPGRRAVESWLPKLRDEFSPDLVLAQADQVASGYGLTTESAEALFSMGVHVLTGGAHFFDKEEGHRIIDRDPRIVRPLNLSARLPGKGFGLYDVGGVTFGVLSILSRTNGELPVNCPFQAVDLALEPLLERTPLILANISGEATAEKVALGWYLDGRVSAVLGSGSHVATADDQILPQGTAYLTEVGMTGPYDSVAGVQKEMALQRLMGGFTSRTLLADAKIALAGVVLDIELGTGRATSIQRLRRE